VVKQNDLQVAKLRPDADQDRASRNPFRTWFVWIWFVGAGAWFFDAAMSLHHHALSSGLLATAISALFLAAGMFFRKQARRGEKL
jgi:hypothetical protein